MNQPEDILHEMEILLKELLGIAQKLCDSSQSSLSKEDLLSLQKRQKELMQQVVDADIAFSRETKGQVNSYKSAAKNRVEKLLEEFQKLNATFIDAIKGSSSLIHFRKK